MAVIDSTNRIPSLCARIYESQSLFLDVAWETLVVPLGVRDSACKNGCAKAPGHPTLLPKSA